MIKTLKKPWVAVPVIFLVLFLALLVFQHTLLPGLVREQILAALEEAGVGNAKVKVTSVSYRGAVLDNLDLGFKSQFRIRQVKVRYTPRSMWKGRITGLVLSGARIDIAFKNGVWDFGPLEPLMEKDRAKGPSTLPFNTLSLEKSVLQLSVEGERMILSLDGAFRKAGANRGIVELRSLFNGAAFKVRADVDFKSGAIQGPFDLSGFDLALLKIIAPLYPPFRGFSAQGPIHLQGKISRVNSRVAGDLSLTGEALSMDIRHRRQPLRLPISALSAKLAMDSSGQINLDLSTGLFGAPMKMTAAVHSETLSGHCEFRMDRIESGILKILQKQFLPDLKAAVKGTLKVVGRAAFSQNKGSVEIDLKGDRLKVQTLLGAGPLDFAPSTVQVRAAFARHGMDFKLVTAQSSAALQTADFLVLSCTDIKADLQFDGRRLTASAAGLLGPWARVTATGDLSFNPDGLSGEIVARVPPFSTRDGKWLAGIIPPIQEDEAGGTLSAEARFKMGKGPLVQHYVFDLQEAVYRKPKSEIDVQGICCTLAVQSFVPFLTDGNQRMTFRSARAGNFRAENGRIAFGFPAVNRVTVPSVEMNWAGGRLFGKDIRMDLSEPRLALDVNVEALDLQAILDFIKYKGAAGDGKIFGHIPIALDWGRRPRLSFGDGFLEARPPKGGLRFSKETAMKILGVKKEINPGTRDEQEIVTLMMVRALQDLEYSSLRMILRNDGRRVLKTRVEAKGYGPRGQRENQIPIGGLNINISNLDDLLNQMMMPKAGAR